MAIPRKPKTQPPEDKAMKEKSAEAPVKPAIDPMQAAALKSVLEGQQMQQMQPEPEREGIHASQVLADMQREPVIKMTQERISKAMQTLIKYQSGKAHHDARLVEEEQWWKMRHWEWMQEKGAKNDIKTPSAWLFNVIISKHADGIHSMPEANVLPREESDKPTAKSLSSIIPCVMEQNEFPDIYSDFLWQKLKSGTGVYGVFWDSEKLNGLGDISVQNINLLHLFWEPGIRDIQKSRNVFHVEPVDKELLTQQYPKLEHEALQRPISLKSFITEDRNGDEDKAYVIDWYYHAYQNGKKVLHYCKFVNSVVLYASEDDPEYAERGFYDHGKYPFVFDPLFPVEGSPCGFGYIAVCKGPQEQIDILNQALIKNALVNAIPRYFVRADGSVNEEEFMDFTKSLVHVTGTLGTDSIMPITPPVLNGNCMAMIENKIGELKETSGNTDSSNGITQNSNQAASAIAALQQAAGKVSAAATISAYSAFNKLTKLIIELIRQFYKAPRKFRITGEMGEEEFMSFNNAGMQPIHQGFAYGNDMGYRIPEFDVKVSAQTRNAYSKNSQNELALALYGNGVFNPQMRDRKSVV